MTLLSTWDLTRATGFVGLALLSLSLVLGALTSARTWRGVELHRQASVVGLGLCTLHGALTAFSPWLTKSGVLAVVAGVLALALAWIAAAGFAARRRLGPRAWRVVHLLGYASVLAAFAHGIRAGTSTPLFAAKIAYLAAAAVVAAVAARRLFQPVPATP